MLAEAFLTLFFLWNVSQAFKNVESKQSIMIHSVKVTPTFIAINGVFALMIKHSVYSVIAEMILEMLFMLFSVCNYV